MRGLAARVFFWGAVMGVQVWGLRDKSTSENESTTLVTNDDGKSTVTLTNEDDKSTTISNQDDKSTTISNQNDKSTTISNQDDKSTTISNQVDLSASVANEDEKSTSVANEDSKSTSVANEDEKSTSVANEDSKSTSVANEDEKSTSVENEEPKAVPNHNAKSNSASKGMLARFRKKVGDGINNGVWSVVGMAQDAAKGVINRVEGVLSKKGDTKSTSGTVTPDGAKSSSDLSESDANGKSVDGVSSAQNTAGAQKTVNDMMQHPGASEPIQYSVGSGPMPLANMEDEKMQDRNRDLAINPNRNELSLLFWNPHWQCNRILDGTTTWCPNRETAFLFKNVPLLGSILPICKAEYKPYNDHILSECAKDAREFIQNVSEEKNVDFAAILEAEGDRIKYDHHDTIPNFDNFEFSFAYDSPFEIPNYGSINGVCRRERGENASILYNSYKWKLMDSSNNYQTGDNVIGVCATQPDHDGSRAAIVGKFRKIHGMDEKSYFVISAHYQHFRTNEYLGWMQFIGSVMIFFGLLSFIPSLFGWVKGKMEMKNHDIIIVGTIGNNLSITPRTSAMLASVSPRDESTMRDQSTVCCSMDCPSINDKVDDSLSRSLTVHTNYGSTIRDGQKSKCKANGEELLEEQEKKSWATESTKEMLGNEVLGEDCNNTSLGTSTSTTSLLNTAVKYYSPPRRLMTEKIPKVTMKGFGVWQKRCLKVSFLLFLVLMIMIFFLGWNEELRWWYSEGEELGKKIPPDPFSSHNIPSNFYTFRDILLKMDFNSEIDELIIMGDTNLAQGNQDIWTMMHLPKKMGVDTDLTRFDDDAKLLLINTNSTTSNTGKNNTGKKNHLRGNNKDQEMDEKMDDKNNNVETPESSIKWDPDDKSTKWSRDGPSTCCTSTGFDRTLFSSKRNPGSRILTTLKGELKDARIHRKLFSTFAKYNPVLYPMHTPISLVIMEENSRKEL